MSRNTEYKVYLFLFGLLFTAFISTYFMNAELGNHQFLGMNNSVTRLQSSGAPIANFTYQLNGYQITCISHSESEYGIGYYRWSFGDGYIQYGNHFSTVQHTYARDGTYLVTLYVEDNDGNNATISCIIFLDNLIDEDDIPTNYIGTLIIVGSFIGGFIVISLLLEYLVNKKKPSVKVSRIFRRCPFGFRKEGNKCVNNKKR